jgi:hypothetical protein
MNMQEYKITLKEKLLFFLKSEWQFP